MAIFSLKDGSKWAKKFDVRILNSIFSLIKKNSVYITKLDHKKSTVWKKLAKNLKTPFCHHMQCIIDPKKGQNGQNKIFQELSLGYFIYKPKIQVKYEKLRRSHYQI